MTLARNEARELLEEHAPHGENWPLHCRQVARVAERISAALRGAGAALDLDRTWVRALLHDIGRSRTHGPFHGWTGFVLLRSLGHPDDGRGCLTHWLKGRTPAEVAASPVFRGPVVERAFAALDPPGWTLEDSVLSLADSGVKHSTVVAWRERHADLIERYGDSHWLRRAGELADEHAAEVSSALGFPVEEILTPLHGDRIDPD